ncbi:MAG: ATP-binding protein [Nocardioidaceae bacterium]
MISGLPLRVRVAIAFGVTTAVALVGLGAFVYYRVEATLAEQTQTSLQTQLAGLTGVPVTGRRQAVETMTGEIFGQVLTPDGSLVASSPQVAAALVSAPRHLGEQGGELTLGQPVRLADEGEGETEEAMLLARRDGGQVLVVGTSLEDMEDALEGVLTQLWVGGPIALLLALGMGYVVAGSALRPIESMRRQAALISARNLDDRLTLPSAHDEIHRLGETLNTMLDRLDAGLRRERDFVAEASHELRTPLALLRMELDLALARPRSNAELQDALGSAKEEVDRLTRLSEDMLLLAASDEERLKIHAAEFDVGELLRTVADRFATQAGGEGRGIGVGGAFPMVVYADRARLDQALSNLVDNAIRHGAGDIELDAWAGDDGVSLRVQDRGLGVDPDLRGRAFDRFSREPGARKSHGRGLGLAIVRAIVEEHNGTVTIGGGQADGRDAVGAVVTIELPAVSV